MAKSNRYEEDEEDEDEAPRRRKRRPREDDDEDDDDEPAPKRRKQKPVEKRVSILGILSLIKGIGGLIVSLIPCIGFLGIFGAGIGLIEGIIALVLAKKSKGTVGTGVPTAGVIVSSIACVISLGWLLLLGAWGASTPPTQPSIPSPFTQPTSPMDTTPTKSTENPPPIDPPKVEPPPTDPGDWGALEAIDLRRYGIYATIALPKGVRIVKNQHKLYIDAGKKDEFNIELYESFDTLDKWKQSYLFLPGNVVLKESAGACQLRNGDERFGTIYMRRDAQIGNRKLTLKADSVNSKNRVILDAMWFSLLSIRQTDAQVAAAKVRDDKVATIKGSGITINDRWIRGPLVSVDVKKWDDSMATALAELGNVDELRVSGSEPADAKALSRIGELKTLNDLKLSGLWATDEILAKLECKELEYLELKNTSVTDSGLRALKKFPALLRFDFSNTKPKKVLGDEGLSNLVGAAKLEDLFLGGQILGASQLATIAQLKGVKELDFENAKFQGAGLSDLTKLPKLRKLDLSGSDVRDQDLAGLRAMMFLTLSDTGVTDAVIPHLLAMPELFSVKLDDTKVTADGFAKLKKDRPKVSVKEK